ncbi:hypothetical protein [Trichlorobacter lovleyi]|uniref:hypothetical protein n=1 Tax=Trichlorobacter lovleyi TaxID=313985 RepID=UPI002480BD87|nr:hypothetical protein [Trichlorobacter lovleyi]
MVAKSRGPCYDIAELVADCLVPGKVIVRTRARETAKEYGFSTQARIVSFISTGAFEKLEHDNTDEIDFGTDAGITFDAYTFKIGPKPVYIAFYKRLAGIWVVKSFHPPEKGPMAPNLTYHAFEALEVLKK